jgi:hypothetical protein
MPSVANVVHLVSKHSPGPTSWPSDIDHHQLAACLENCRSAGALPALEPGPGTTSSRMASTLFPDGRARAVEDFRSLAGLRAWLQRAMG